MKFTTLTAALVFALSGNVLALDNNYSDDLDANKTPSSWEDRENEVGNTIDSYDANVTPAQKEERERQEDLESDVIQKDDAEKEFDVYDDELDE